MIKKKVLAVVSSALILSMLPGCVVAPKTEETEETEKAVKWTDEQGVKGTDQREFNIVGFPYYMNDDRTEHSPDVFPVSADMTYRFVSAEVSEPDKFGQVTYTVVYDYDIDLLCFDDDTDRATAAGYTKSNAQVRFFNVVDGNTGTVPNRDDVYNGSSSLTLTEIFWGSERYTIGWSMRHENYWDDWTYETRDDGDYSRITLHRPVTMTIVAPEGFDDVYLFIGKNEDTEYDIERYEDIESHVWGDEEGEISDYYFVKLTDLL